jgi:hypothetical protein
MTRIHFLLLLAFLVSCATQVKEENRLEQIYLFSTSNTLYYKKESDIESPSLKGQIKFEKNRISLVISSNGEEIAEECIVRTVTLEKDPSDIRYRTNKGDFIVKVKGDTIIDVTLYTDEFLTIFNRSNEASYTQTKLPLPIGAPKKDWARVEIDEVGTIDLPPLMEIQDETFKARISEYQEGISESSRIRLDEHKIVFQQKGLNQTAPNSTKRYARVIIDLTKGKPNDFYPLNQKIVMSEKELSNLDTDIRNNLIKSFEKTELVLVEWYPTRVVEINGMDAIKVSYTRRMRTEPLVLVDIYRFQNNDRMHSLTISYRLTEKDYWHASLTELLNSFRISNIN